MICIVCVYIIYIYHIYVYQIYIYNYTIYNFEKKWLWGFEASSYPVALSSLLKGETEKDQDVDHREGQVILAERRRHFLGWLQVPKFKGKPIGKHRKNGKPNGILMGS